MKIAIVGGGISGLVAAYRLSRSKFFKDEQIEIHLFDGRSCLGGVIQTESQSQFLMERGPDAFITAKPWALELVKELGLENALLETNAKARNSFILSKETLIPVPRGFYLMAPTNIWDALKTPLISFKGKLRMACEYFIPRKCNTEDESLASFVKRRFGREVLERIAQPMIAGIYTADPEKLSLEATFPHFLKMEKNYGSVIRALSKQKDSATKKASGPRYSLFLSFKNGMRTLIDQLIKEIPGVHIHVEAEIENVQKKSSWELSLKKGQPFYADYVCLAIPAPLAGRLLLKTNLALSRELQKISYENVATVNLAYKKSSIGHALNGSGYVVPAIERKNIVGCTFSNMKFPDRGYDADADTVLLRVFLGGASSRSLLKSSDAEILTAVCHELNEQLQITGKPISWLISHWPQSIPQYQVGHRQVIEKIFHELGSLKGLYLTGNAYNGTGIPDCIHHASKVAGQMLSDIEAQILKKEHVGSR